MKPLTPFQQRVLAEIRAGYNRGSHEWALAHRLYPDFERRTDNRGARVSAISRSIYVLIKRRLVAQSNDLNEGRYQTYFAL